MLEEKALTSHMETRETESQTEKRNSKKGDITQGTTEKVYCECVRRETILYPQNTQRCYKRGIQNRKELTNQKI